MIVWVCRACSERFVAMANIVCRVNLKGERMCHQSTCLLNQANHRRHSKTSKNGTLMNDKFLDVESITGGYLNRGSRELLLEKGFNYLGKKQLQ